MVIGTLTDDDDGDNPAFFSIERGLHSTMNAPIFTAIQWILCSLLPTSPRHNIGLSRSIQLTQVFQIHAFPTLWVGECKYVVCQSLWPCCHCIPALHSYPLAMLLNELPLIWSVPAAISLIPFLTSEKMTVRFVFLPYPSMAISRASKPSCLTFLLSLLGNQLGWSWKLLFGCRQLVAIPSLVVYTIADINACSHSAHYRANILF